MQAIGRLFDEVWYVARYPEAGTSALEPLAYYCEVGDPAGHWPHLLFDPAHYGAQHPELPTEGGARFAHYALEGGRDGSDPHPLFHSLYYLGQCSELPDPDLPLLAHYLAGGEARGLAPNPLFRPDHYRKTYPDLAGVDCLLPHYVRWGADEGRSPNPLFTPDFYLEQSRGRVTGRGELLAHYIASGDEEGLLPHPLFDPDYYALGCQGQLAGEGLRLGHYLDHGHDPGAAPHPLFDPAYYAEQIGSAPPSNETLLAHYLRCGGDLKPNPLFDSAYYERFGNTGEMSPLVHYARHGGASDFPPNPLFDSHWVRRQIPASISKKVTPLEHYFRVRGDLEKGPHALFDTAWYVSEYPEAAQSSRDALSHFFEEGADRGFDPHPLFYSNWYRNSHADYFTAETPSIFHYIESGHAQGLAPNPLFNGSFYTGENGVELPEGETALSHYCRIGLDKMYPPSKFFSFCLLFFRNASANLRDRSVNPAGGYLLEKYSDSFSPKSEVAIHLEPIYSPQVSIIIPVYGQLAYTLACLRSISHAQTAVKFEVLVVDDHSPVGDFQPLAEIDNLRVIRNEKNLGFLRSCNRGAAEARGQELVILNNDTLVTDHWLDRLLESREAFPDAGLIGSQLVFPDGCLQEAGGIVWSDGSAVNYGHGEDPANPRYSFARKVDYVSAASVLIDRQFFHDLGGFDEAYAPAFYEDVDLAFKVREAGKDVVCQSGSVVIHFGGTSHGRDTTTGLKRYQVLNRQTFLEKWKNRLKDYRKPFSNLERASRGAVGSQALIIDATLLTPDRDAGSLRMFNLIKVLQKMNFAVTFIPNDLSSIEEYVGRLQRSGVQVICSPHVDSIERYLQLSGTHFDLCMVSRPDTAEKCLDLVKIHCPNALVLYDTVDLHFLRREREIQLTGIASTEESIREQELWAAGRADAAIVVSEYDRSRLLEQVPTARIHILSLIHEVESRTNPFDERSGILFIGGFQHLPNVDAVLWFLKDVFPAIQGLIPGLRFHIIGPDPPKEIRDQASECIVIEGFLESVEEQFMNRRLSIAPLRYGSGVKGKINQSMAYGLPCVATSAALEGMEIDWGSEILVADGAQAFAETVVDLYENRDLWDTISRNSAESIERLFSKEVAEENMRDILRQHRRKAPDERV